jgi:hypothetical protein
MEKPYAKVMVDHIGHTHTKLIRPNVCDQRGEDWRWGAGGGKLNFKRYDMEILQQTCTKTQIQRDKAL